MHLACLTRKQWVRSEEGILRGTLGKIKIEREREIEKRYTDEQTGRQTDSKVGRIKNKDTVCTWLV